MNEVQQKQHQPPSPLFISHYSNHTNTHTHTHTHTEKWERKENNNQQMNAGRWLMADVYFVPDCCSLSHPPTASTDGAVFNEPFLSFSLSLSIFLSVSVPAFFFVLAKIHTRIETRSLDPTPILPVPTTDQRWKVFLFFSTDRIISLAGAY